MIMGPDRERVVSNIVKAWNEGRWNDKVEFADPVLSSKEERDLLGRFVRLHERFWFPLASWFVDRSINVAETLLVNRRTRVAGAEKLSGIREGMIFTCNHFNQLDSTVLRTFARRHGHGRLYVVSEPENLLLPGILRVLVNYTDLLPISHEQEYMRRYFEPVLRRLLARGQWVLIYPEQEMWWNFKRPRPCKRGAYYYASLCGCPVVSCFVEETNEPGMDRAPFHKVRHTLHILGVLRSDPSLSPRENSKVMAEEDWRLKREAYERIYGKRMDAPLSFDDIAGLEEPLS